MAGPLDDAGNQCAQRVGFGATRRGLEPGAGGGPARWLVYIGKFGPTPIAWPKARELTAMNLRPGNVHTPAAGAGVVAGVLKLQAANAELGRLQVWRRTARVVQACRIARPDARYPTHCRHEGAGFDTKAALAGKPLHACNWIGKHAVAFRAALQSAP